MFQDKEQLILSILDNLPASIHIQAPDYSILFANRYFREHFGPPEGKKCYEILAGRKEPCEMCQTFRTFDTKSPQKWSITALDGRVYEIYDYLFSDSDPPLLLELSVDITERKQAEEILKESEEKFRLLAETVQDVFWMTTPGFTETIYINPAYEKVWGRRRDDLYRNPLSFMEAIIPEDREQVLKEIKENPEEVWDFEYRIVRSDGSMRWIQDRGFPVRDEQGNITKMIGMATDITDRKIVEERLREHREHLEALVAERTAELRAANDQLQQEISNRKRAEEAAKVAYAELSHIFNATADGICMIDKDFKLLQVNNAFCTLFDVRKSEAIGKSCREIFHHSLCHTPKCPLSHILSGEERFEYDLELEHSDGVKTPCILTATPLKDSGSRIIGMVEIFKDITERKKVEEELQKTEKLESLGLLAGGIAHDFNNILVSLVGSLSLLESCPKADEKCHEILKRAERAATRARDLTRQLLTFSKGGAPIKKACSITELVKDTALFSLRGSKVRCEFTLPDDLWPVEIDEGQISQVINNLIMNANQAMPTGGMVKIIAENVTIGQESNLPLKGGRYIKILIQDKGIGIPEENLHKIFYPFFTTKERGSGLGLTGAYSIIKRHEGYITVESQVGIGTTFSIYLPVSQKEIFTLKNVEEGILFSGQGKILFMDDEKDVRDTAGDMLKHMGFDVEFARDGAEAIKLYQKAKRAGQSFKAVILDLTIPGGMGGKDAIQELLKIDPEVKAIVSSGYSNLLAMAEYEQYGFSGMLAKPYNMKELGEVLSKVFKELKG